MKTNKLSVIVFALLFAVGLVKAQMIQRNYNGVGLVYCNTPGVTEIGIAPTTTGIVFVSPTFTTPNLGVAAVTTLNGNTFTTGTYTLTGSTGKTLTFSNSLTLAGTDSTTMTFPTTSATLARTDAANTFTGASTATSWAVVSPVITTGLTASGSAANDFSASTGTFKTSTGAATYGGSTNTFTNGLQVGSGVVQHFYNNQSTATQTPAAATRTYIAGSALTITAGQIQVGTIMRWHFNLTKTAAGSASSTFDIAFGTAGTTSDTARVSFTKPAGTAAADEGWVDIECVIKTNSASGVAVGEFRMIHNLASTGHAVIPCVCVNTTSSTFDTTTPTTIGICITTGASDAITIAQVSAEATNL